jgi:putative ATP-binding cassette transporter
MASSLSRGMILATVNEALASAGTGKPSTLHIAAFFGFFVLFLGTTYYSMSRAKMVVEEMMQRMRLGICDKLLYTGLDFIENQGTGALYARLTQDVNYISGSALTIVTTLQSAVLVLFCIIYIGWLTWVGMVATLLTILAAVVIYYAQDRTATTNFHEVRAKEAEFFDSLGDLLKGFKEIKINRGKHAAIGRWVRHISDVYRTLSVRTELMYIRSFLTSEIFLFSLVAFLVFVLPFTFKTETTTIFQFLAAILFLIGPLESLVKSIPAVTRARVSLDRITELGEQLDAAIIEGENREFEIAPMRFDTISLKGIEYRFSTHQSDDYFDLGPVDLQLKKGEVLFFVGGNGSGKTTLLKILTGLYRPVAGEIRVDGKAIANEDYQAYREMFTTIFGDFHLFQRVFGLKEIDAAAFNDLLKELQLDAKTHFEDDRFSTINLSTGQRKRLAYAICHMEDRDIFVFDEFAAEQDPTFRQYFYETLLPALKQRGKTVIAVTHDDAYFHACDRVVKMDYGKVAADGSPDEVSWTGLLAQEQTVVDVKEGGSDND